MSREDAARIGGMDRQTLRDWVHRFNRHGVDGLIDGKAPGRRSKLSAEQKEELRQLVEAGPDLDKDGVVGEVGNSFCAASPLPRPVGLI
jgi:transposase